MKTKKIAISDLREFDISIKKSKSEKYILKLYVAGLTPQSVSAIENLKRICEEHLKGKYQNNQYAG